jgi:hypothetical protein
LVADFAIASPKPSEFGSTGAYWKDAGWLLPVDWQEPEISVSPKTIITQLAEVLPRSHSPVRAATGGGNQKAYLAEVDRAVLELVLSSAGLDVRSYEAAKPALTIDEFRAQAEDALEQEIRGDLTLDETVRKQLTCARRGQGLFRRRVLTIEPVCRVTGIANPALLVASHVKPWRSCKTADERLDGFNGLMLAPHADFLFDKGLIGFEDDGRTIYSPRMTDEEGIKLGMYNSQLPSPRELHPKSVRYFEHHRRNVFLS